MIRRIVVLGVSCWAWIAVAAPINNSMTSNSLGEVTSAVTTTSPVDVNADNSSFSQQQYVADNETTSSQNNAADLSVAVQQLQQAVTNLQGMVESQGRMLQNLQSTIQLLQQNHTVATSPIQPSVANNAMPNTNTMNSAQGGEALYIQAYQAIQKKQYVQAQQGLMQYLQQFPNGPESANAHYWLGELYAVGGSGSQAMTQFTTVVNNYPNSDKVPEAMLKLGIINYSANQYAQSKMWYQKLVNQYPNSSAAKIATSELNQLNRAGY